MWCRARPAEVAVEDVDVAGKDKPGIMPRQPLVFFGMGLALAWFWVSLAIAYVARLEATAAWFVGALVLFLLFGALGTLTLVVYLVGALLQGDES